MQERKAVGHIWGFVVSLMSRTIGFRSIRFCFFGDFPWGA